MPFSDRDILGQASWLLSSRNVEMAVTKRGAHMAPVRFACERTNGIEPYYISPWQEEGLQLDGLWSEVPLRGDFFCLPFGNGRFEERAEIHPSHGETSGALWSFVAATESSGLHSLELELHTQSRRGRVQRTFTLVDGHDAVYSATTIHGFEGPVTLGHHAVLRPPAIDAAKLLLSSSSIQFGQVYPRPFGSPADGEYQALHPGSEFVTLQAIPSIFRNRADEDCSSWPGLEGFTDLLQIATAATSGAEPAWIAAVNASEGYLWFGLKDPHVLPSTVLWRENRGRHGAPWSGRNCALGIEDVCSFFDSGIAESAAPNPFSQRGIRTHHDLSGEPFEVRYIQGIALCAPDFGKVVRAEFSASEASFFDTEGRSALASLCSSFLFGESLTLVQEPLP